MATKGNLGPFRVHFRGFDAASRVFLLDLRSESDGTATPAKRREIGDFQALDRALAKLGHLEQRPAVPRLSLRRLKKLTEHSWQRGDTSAGWRRELQKNVAACEQWVELALAAAPAAVGSRFADDDAYAAHHRARAETQLKTQRAKQLQQYFTSASLLQHVVARLRDVLGELGLASLESDRVTWLEPSCGDGRIVEALAAGGAKHVIGYELDERMCAVARSKLQHIDTVTIHHGDYLKSTPSFVPEGTTVMALGNPPFGCDGPVDAAEASERDLVMKFVAHTVHAWEAHVVAFIVPARCAKSSYLESVLADLSDGRKLQDGATEANRKAWTVVMCEPLEDCTFEFQETKHVKQPSAFVVFSLQNPKI